MDNPTAPGVPASDRPSICNTGRLFRVRSRLGSYLIIAYHAWRRGIPLRFLLRTQFPHHFRDESSPTVITVELTNHCDLKCGYCNSPKIEPRWRGSLGNDSLEAIVDSLSRFPKARIRLVGHGEPTLHPSFGEFARRLSGASTYLSITTNGQWKRSEIVDELIGAPFDLVEVSVDAGTPEEYESVRSGASYARLLQNLETLRSRSRESGRRRPLVNIRLMVRPSQKPVEAYYRRFWRAYADTVMPQYVIERDLERTVDGDAFRPASSNEAFTKCAAPLKSIIIGWTGKIQFCKPVGIVGDINSTPLIDVWSNGTYGRYRSGQFTGNSEMAPKCTECIHAT